MSIIILILLGATERNFWERRSGEENECLEYSWDFKSRETEIENRWLILGNEIKYF